MKKGTIKNRDKVKTLQRKMQIKYKLSVICIGDGYNLKFEL